MSLNPQEIRYRQFLKNQARMRMFELFAQQLTDESTMMEVAELYPRYEDLIDQKLKPGDKFIFGENVLGDPQIYLVVGNAHVVQGETPQLNIAQYKLIGVKQGYAIWTKPHNAQDAYDKGDIVWHNDELWISTHPGKNNWEPGVKGWDRYK